MEIIKAINIQELGLNLEKIGDFLYHEGPLLSLFKDKQNPNHYYFYKWADCDERCNRWLIFPVTTEILRGFLFKEIPLRKIILNNAYVFFIDLNNDLEAEQYLIASSSEIPNSYLPSENSFYKEECYTDFANNFKQTVALSTIIEKYEVQALYEKTLDDYMKIELIFTILGEDAMGKKTVIYGETKGIKGNDDTKSLSAATNF